MSSRLVIVESPTKAKTIRKFLSKDFVVEASVGHVRDLPQSAADIPKEYKDKAWGKLGVNVENDFAPIYVVPKSKIKLIAELKKKLKSATELYLATDEDREGESIAWHLVQVLKPKIPIKRMVFHEITKRAIEESLTKIRNIDEKLVRAQETRRVLDRLVGYTLSPLLWKKIAFGLSAGRVQSVALRLIVDRERTRIRFIKSEYWDLLAKFAKTGEAFEARLISIGEKRLATGKDFSDETGALQDGKSVLVLEAKQASDLVTSIKTGTFDVLSVEEKPLSTRPAPPFVTSTLQQEANRKLGLSARDTMRMAQRLYEEGLITYMRTDSPSLSQEAIAAARREVVSLYGQDYLSPEVRQYSAKSKGAQEAHEAIRPAGSEFVHPKEAGLSGRDLALYELIWKRTMATQMTEAKKLSLSVKIKGEKDTLFNATGTRILFPGFLRAYVEGSDDPEGALEDKEILLPKLQEGDRISLKDLKALMHETKPTARFTEASLVQTLEKEGIGRPSTYASIIGTIIERGYVRRVGPSLVPTFTGFAVTQLLEKNFPEYVDTKFTSEMELSLDEIAEGERESLPYLKKFYLGKDGLEERVKLREKNIKADESRTVDLPHIHGVEVRIGRFGPYIVKEGDAKSDDKISASIPEDIPPADLTAEDIQTLVEAQEKGPQSIGKDSKTGMDVFVLIGRYGPYVQLGMESETTNPKPKRASLPKGVDPKLLTIQEAEHLLALPRELGKHPKSGKPIVANNGRFGPYVMHDGDFRSLKKTDNVYTVDLSRALEILSEEKKGRGGSTKIKDLGNHPQDAKPIALYEGRYGVFIKYGTINATVPKDIKPEEVTLQKALEFLAAKKTKKAKKK